MLDFIMENWAVIIGAICGIVVIGYGIYKFLKTPTAEQIKEVKEWLLFAVVQAEKELGSGTGQLKLRYVYDLFISHFPALVSLISFDTFAKLVDEVLDQCKDLLEDEKIKSYIDKE